MLPIFHVNSTFTNILTEKNGDMFNTYFTCCKYILCVFQIILNVASFSMYIFYILIIQNSIGCSHAEPVEEPGASNIPCLLWTSGSILSAWIRISLMIYDYWRNRSQDLSHIFCMFLRKQVKSSQVKLSFIVIPLHVWTYSGTRCHASQDHGAT